MAYKKKIDLIDKLGINKSQDSEQDTITTQEEQNPKTNETSSASEQQTTQKEETANETKANSTNEQQRPSIERGCKVGEARTTIILNKELTKKVKYIALTRGSSIKDIVTEVLTELVERWEAEEGKIKV